MAGLPGEPMQTGSPMKAPPEPPPNRSRAASPSGSELKGCLLRFQADVEQALTKLEDNVLRCCKSPGSSEGSLRTPRSRPGWFPSPSPLAASKNSFFRTEHRRPSLSGKRTPGRKITWTMRYGGQPGAGQEDGGEDECLMLRDVAAMQERRGAQIPAIITDFDSPCNQNLGRTLGSSLGQEVFGGNDTVTTCRFDSTGVVCQDGSDDSLALDCSLSLQKSAAMTAFDSEGSVPLSDCSELRELPELREAKVLDMPTVGIGGRRMMEASPPISAWSEEQSTFADSLATLASVTEKTKCTPGNQITPESTFDQSIASGRQQSRTSTSRSLPFVSKNKTRMNLSPLSKKKLAIIKDGESCLQRVTRSQTYELVSAVLIILNALFIVWETQQRALEAMEGVSGDSDIYFSVLSNFFCMCFLLDLVFRMGAERYAFFFRYRERAWNGMDILVVITALGEVSVQWYQFASGSVGASNVRLFLRKFSMLRIARLFRVVRRTKAMWVIRLIKELRIMVLCLVGALKSLLWAMVLLLIILAVFGVFFTDGAVAFCVNHDRITSASTEDLRRYFGTLSRSVLTLFKAMSGGEDWSVILESLDPLPYEYTLFFLFFIAFGILALMNVVTAVFVGAALQRTQTDRELVVQEQMENKTEFRHTMEQIFYELDSNGSGELNLDEFESYMEDEKIKAFLSTCQLDIDQVKTMFMLLDTDKTGTVDLDEFISGIFRLKGMATSLDLAFLIHSVEDIHKNLASMQEHFGVERRASVSDRPVSRTIRSAGGSRMRPRP